MTVVKMIVDDECMDKLTVQGLVSSYNLVNSQLEELKAKPTLESYETEDLQYDMALISSLKIVIMYMTVLSDREELGLDF
jgi:hypothetical protein